MKTLDQLCEKCTDEYGTAYKPTDQSLAYVRAKQAQFKRLVRAIRDRRVPIDHKLLDYGVHKNGKLSHTRLNKRNGLTEQRDRLYKREQYAKACYQAVCATFQAEIAQIQKEPAS